MALGILVGLTALTAVGLVRVMLWGGMLLKKAPWLPPVAGGLPLLATAEVDIQVMVALLLAGALSLFLTWRLLRFVVGHKTLAMLVIVTLTVVSVSATSSGRQHTAGATGRGR